MLSTWPSKATTAASTSATPCAQQASLTTYRLSKLSVQSTTTSAPITMASAFSAVSSTG